MIQIRSATYIGSARGATSFPEPSLPEVAIIGRSNAGKSTLINRLCGNTKLARVSSTPGRTQEIHFFSIHFSRPAKKSPSLILVDLPGYGFAKVSKDQRAALHELIHEYLTSRDSLKVVCLLADIRRDPEEDEHELRELISSLGIHLLVVPTKCDKLSKNELSRRLQELSVKYYLEPTDLLPTGEGIPLSALWERVLTLSTL